MTAPIPPLRRAMQRPTPREIADRSNRGGNVAPGATARENSQGAKPKTHRLDDLAEYLLTKRGRENTALIALTLACIIGIGITIRYG